jgi:glycosyltransferase 2 family protein
MMNRNLGRILAGTLFVLGLVVVALWVRFAGGPELLEGIVRMNPGYALLLAGLTVLCVVLRFVRWQFLLRRLHVRVPTRRSLSIYLASLAGIATPAYVGEAIRSVFLRRAFGTPVTTTLAAWVAERLMDFGAIALLGGAALTGSPFVVGALLVAALAVAVMRSKDGTLRSRAVLLPTLGLTILAWFPATLVIGVAAHALGVPVGMLEGMRVFSAATFGGGLSLMPAGMGTTGSFAILQLQGLGIDLREAVTVVSVFRLATAGITLAVGGAFLLAELRLTRARTPSAEEHFDNIAGEYLDQFAPHIWDLLLARKTALLCSALPAPRPASTGLDLGCGLGRQAIALRERGYRVIGLDPAHNLLRHAQRAGLATVTASGLQLPVADASVDFVYTVGVLHHLVGPGWQEAACREVSRVLRPGGVFVIHETNPRNPLFRLYMGYLFPVLRSIDEGIERWIDAERWSEVDALQLERIEYFTFLPDFLPRALLKAVLPLERWLERSPMRRYSVHYMAVLRKPSVSPDAEGRLRSGAAADARV